MKRCSKCKVERSSLGFSLDNSKKDKLCSWCKQCSKEQHAALRGHRRFYSIKSNYGLDKETYDRMLEAQAGVCAVCFQPSAKRNQVTMNLHVDHCHTTGKIRGLLCNSCNSALGFLKDDEALVANALNYLRKEN